MGSLPNLHELEEAERKREKRREYELLLEQRARDTSRECERLSVFAQQRKVSAIHDRSSSYRYMEINCQLDYRQDSTLVQLDLC